jgi:MFS family permease
VILNVLKNWKLHVLAFILVVICELIGTHKVSVGPGVLLFLPMLYAMIIGGFISWPKLRLVKLEQMHYASAVLSLLTLLLVTKLGIVIGPSVGKLLNSGLALSLQELGHFLGTVVVGLPLAIFLGLGRESVGATFSIDREPNIAIIAEKYGLDSPEGRGVMSVYICGTVFGAVWIGLIAGCMASLQIFHPYALAMGAGVGSGSMMAAATGAITAVFPEQKNEILMYAGASNLLTTIIGIYFCLFISLPVTNYLYKVLTPLIGRRQAKGGVAK